MFDSLYHVSLYTVLGGKSLDRGEGGKQGEDGGG